MVVSLLTMQYLTFRVCAF